MNNVITQLLDLMRVQSTAYIAKNLSAPWGVYVDAYPELARFHFVVSGSTWIGLPNGGPAEKVFSGDIAIVPRGKAHSYYDQTPAFDAKPRNYPVPGRPPYFERFHHDSDQTHLLCGYFEMSANAPATILTRLPNLLIGRHDPDDITRTSELLVDLAAAELANPSTGFEIRLNRLTEMLCVQTLQTWLEQALEEDDYLRALADPRTKVVLDHIHSDPTADWTVKALAQLYGQSRTTFTSHFKRATGLSPMTYVRQYRLKRACQMLKETTLSIDEIAFKSGYADSNAFNRAFKRTIGVSPGAYRRHGPALWV